jgi:dephospho-CoA kinase
VVIDADSVARDVLEPGEPATDLVIARFGRDLRRPDGSLDRAALGAIVFADPAALRDLEAIVHPAVRPRILAALEDAEAGGATAVIIEAIKLIEGGLASVCDEVWLVDCDPAVQRERLLGRGGSGDDADRRIQAQTGLLERARPVATRVIDTSSERGTTRSAVESAFDDALRETSRARTTEDPDQPRL